jgi:hypothetical protein
LRFREEGSVIVLVVIAAVLVIAEEALRWVLRPEARRLRVIKKIGGRR